MLVLALSCVLALGNLVEEPAVEQLPTPAEVLAGAPVPPVVQDVQPAVE